jgi:hypothetical protein
MRGLEMPWSKVIIIILAFVATFFIVGSVLKVWPGVESIIEIMNLNGECSKWNSEKIPYNPETFTQKNYPTLYKKFGDNYQQARKYCEPGDKT